MNTTNCICMIPARIGSQRFKKKNLALIGNKTILEIGIENAIKANIFDEIILNGDHDIFQKIAEKKGIKYYKRAKKLGSSDTKSDDVVYDFICKYSCQNIVWLNAIAPLQTLDDIKGFTLELKKNNIDSQFATKKEYLQAIYKNEPLNFSCFEKFSKTQDLNPIELFVPSLMGWKCKSFIKKYEKDQHAFFCGNINYYQVSSLSSIVIKTENDFRLARSVIEGIASYDKKISYFNG